MNNGIVKFVLIVSAATLLSCSSEQAPMTIRKTFLSGIVGIDISNEKVIFLYIKEDGCQTCNLSMMTQLAEVKNRTNVEIIAYFSSNTSYYWKRIIKSMNLNYEVHFGKPTPDIESLLCDDGKVAVLFLPQKDIGKRLCTFEEVLHEL